VTSWKQPKRRGVLSPEQRDFKARRLKVIVRRYRAWLRQTVEASTPGDEVGDVDFGGMFD
jgi:hypothetical protein